MSASRVWLDSGLVSADLMAGLRSVARGIVASDDVAMDCVQEALLCLWQQEQLPEDPRNWLVRTVVHKAMHARRAAVRRTHHEDRARLERPEHCPLCDPLRDAEEQEWREQIESAIRTLSAELQSALRLRWENDLEYEEIARRLQIPLGTVRSRLARARAALAARLGEKEPDAELAAGGRESPRGEPGLRLTPIQ